MKLNFENINIVNNTNTIQKSTVNQSNQNQNLSNNTSNSNNNIISQTIINSSLSTNFSYKYLLVKNVIANFEKTQYQEAKKDLKKCFMLDSQNNNSESIAVFNLCLILIFYKKNEIKKVFQYIEEINTKVLKEEISPVKFQKAIKEEEYLGLLYKKIILKEVLQKKNMLTGLSLEEIFKKENIWMNTTSHLFLLFNCFFTLMFIQKNSLINSSHKIQFLGFFGCFKENICNCEECNLPQIKNIINELEGINQTLNKSSSTIIISNDDISHKISSIYKTQNVSDKDLNEKKQINNPNLNKLSNNLYYNKSNQNTINNFSKESVSQGKVKQHDFSSSFNKSNNNQGTNSTNNLNNHLSKSKVGSTTQAFTNYSNVSNKPNTSQPKLKEPRVYTIFNRNTNQNSSTNLLSNMPNDSTITTSKNIISKSINSVNREIDDDQFFSSTMYSKSTVEKQKQSLKTIDKSSEITNLKSMFDQNKNISSSQILLDKLNKEELRTIESNSKMQKTSSNNFNQTTKLPNTSLVNQKPFNIKIKSNQNSIFKNDSYSPQKRGVFEPNIKNEESSVKKIEVLNERVARMNSYIMDLQKQSNEFKESNLKILKLLESI